MADNNLNVQVTASLSKIKSVAQINSDIQKIEGQLKKLKLQATIDGKSITEIQKQITALNKQKKQLYIDLKLRQKDLKKQYKEAMAQVRTQPLDVNVDTSDAQRQISGLNSTLSGTSSEAVTLGNSINKVLNNAGLVVSAQTALQTIRKAAQEATEAVKEYDSYVKNLKIITNKDDVSDLIADYANRSLEMKVDVSEYEQASEVILRAGKNLKESTEYTETAIKLAKTGFIDADEAASNLITVANAYDITTDKLKNVTDVLLSLDSMTNTTAGNLSSALSRSAQNAKLAGMSYTELSSTIAKLRDTTGKTETELSNSMNQILNRTYRVKLGKYILENEDGSTEDITQELSDVEKMLNTVGVSIRDTKGEFKDFTEIISAIAPVFDDLSDVAKNSIANVLGGSYHKNVVLSLISEWSDIQKLVEDVNNNTNVTDTKYNAYLDSIEGKTAALSTAMKELWNNLIPNGFVTDLTDAATGLVQFVNEYQILQTLIKSATFYALAKGIIATKNSLLGIVNDLKNVSTAFSQLDALQKASSGTYAYDTAINNLGKTVSVLTDKQIKLLLSTNNLSDTQKIAILKAAGLGEAEAITKIQTLGLAQANTTATASTFSLASSFKALFATISANPIMALTLAFTTLLTIYQTVQRKQEEARQEIKDTADKAKELTDNINSLYQSYSDMKIAVDNGTESKENLTSATNDLLEALGYEGSAVDELIEKYGNLENAIDNVVISKLQEAHGDLVNSVNVYKDELLKIGDDWSASKWGNANTFSFLGDNKEYQKIKDVLNQAEGLTSSVSYGHNGRSNRYSYSLSGDNSTIEGIKQNYETLLALQEDFINEFGAEKAGELDIYKEINSRLNEIKTAYENYTSEVEALNQNASKTQVLQSLIGKELPQTIDEYKAYRQELIKSAQSSGAFIGSQEDIANSIDNTLSQMSEFEKFQNRLNNLKTAKSLFVEGRFNSKPINDYIESLSDEELEILIQLDPDIFDKGIDYVKQAIENFNADSDNNIEVEAEVDTQSLDDLQKAYDDISKSADSFIKNQKLLTTVLEEQEKYAQLSASTIRELADAGYSEALISDTVTGAVTLNQSAYEELNKQKKEKIRLDLINEKSNLEDKLKDEQTAISDLVLEYQALSKVGIEANSARLSEITLELAKRGADISDISNLISQINGDIKSLDAPTFGDSSKPDSVLKFETELAKRQHEIATGKRKENADYYDWLLIAAHKAYDGLADYEDDLWKYEEQVYEWRKDHEQDLFDQKIENLDKEKEKALENNDFSTAKASVNTQITETQKRIVELKTSGKQDVDDEIKQLEEDLEDLGDTLNEINSQEYEFNISIKEDSIEDLEKEFVKSGDTSIYDKQIGIYTSLIADAQDEINRLLDLGYSKESDEIQELVDQIDEYSEDIANIWEKQTDVIKDNVDEQIEALDRSIENTGDTKLYSEKIKVYKDGQQQILDMIKFYREQGYAEDSAIIKELKKQWNDYQDSISDALQEQANAQVEAYNELLDEQKELLEQQKEAQDEYYDSEIKALEDKKEALEKVNETIEEQNELEEKRQAIAEAERNLYKNVRLVYSGGQWVQKAREEDLQAVKDAENDLSDTLRKQEIEALENQITALNDAKDEYDETIDKQITAIEESEKAFEKAMENSYKVRQQLDYEFISAIVGDDKAKEYQTNADNALKAIADSEKTDSADNSALIDSNNAVAETNREVAESNLQKLSADDALKSIYNSFQKSGALLKGTTFEKFAGNIQSGVLNATLNTAPKIADDVVKGSMVNNYTVNNNPTINTTVNVYGRNKSDEEIANIVATTAESKVTQALTAFVQGATNRYTKMMYSNE